MTLILSGIGWKIDWNAIHTDNRWMMNMLSVYELQSILIFFELFFELNYV